MPDDKCWGHFSRYNFLTGRVSKNITHILFHRKISGFVTKLSLHSLNFREKMIFWIWLTHIYLKSIHFYSLLLQMIGGETTSQNMTSSGYKHQQHMLMQHQQKLHQQQQYQKQHPQRTTSNLPSTQQQQPPSQPQYHPPQPVHTSTPLQQPRLNQVQSSPGDTHNHATHSEDPLHLPQHNPAAAAYFPSNQRNHCEYM